MTTTQPTTISPQSSVTGRVAQIMGPVVDVDFPEGELPEIFYALRVERDPNPLICEVQKQLSGSAERTASSLRSWDSASRSSIRATSIVPRTGASGNVSRPVIRDSQIRETPQPDHCVNWIQALQPNGLWIFMATGFIRQNACSRKISSGLPIWD